MYYKKKVTQGFIWNIVDKFFSQIVQFIIGIILARLLMPSDYGIIGMLTLFIAISSSFIDSGMNAGLIQKKEKTDLDFSTVFVFNLVVSVIFYFVLFFLAPYIASFFKTPQLTGIARILTLNIIINALAIVQRSRLSIDINFKAFAKINSLSIFLGGITGIASALYGLGVWALVIQNLVGATFSTLLLWYFSKWKPSIAFSKQSFKELFGFGSRLLIAAIYAQTFNHLYNILIGKYFSSSELGHYTRAKGYADLASETFSSIINQVSFPVLSSFQAEKERMTNIFNKLIRMSAFIIIPAMIILFLIAKPFIIILLGNKWIQAIPLLQYLCLARIFYPLSVLNLNMLNSYGKTNIALKTDLSKFPFIALTLFITIPLGVKAVVIGHIITSIIGYVINTYPNGKIFNYGLFKQIYDLRKIILASIVMFLIVFLLNFLYDKLIIVLFVNSIVGITVYLIMCKLLKIEEISEIKLLLKSIY